MILLLDDRFLRRDHLELFPREWEHFQVVNRGKPARCLGGFLEWKGALGPPYSMSMNCFAAWDKGTESLEATTSFLAGRLWASLRI